MRKSVCSGYAWREQGCVQAASGENKGVLRLLQVRIGCVQAASGENKGVLRLLQVRIGCVQAALGENKDMFRQCLEKTRVCSVCFG